MSIMAMATKPKSAGASKRANTMVLAKPTPRSISLKATIQTAPLAISLLIFLADKDDLPSRFDSQHARDAHFCPKLYQQQIAFPPKNTWPYGICSRTLYFGQFLQRKLGFFKKSSMTRFQPASGPASAKL